MMYGSWDMECGRQNFLSLWTVFCLFTPLWTQKIKNFEKMEKKKLEDIIILQMFTINDSHMVYGFSDVECNSQIFLTFWTIFCPFTPHNNPKNQNSAKLKKSLKISSFYICVPKIMIRWCTVPEIWCVTDVIVISHFGLFFALLLP